MPTNNFFNLPIEKKKKIMNAAKSEFVEYSFYDASINRIIKNAGISRGSFYMYFENKEDISNGNLYLWLCNQQRF